MTGDPKPAQILAGQLPELLWSPALRLPSNQRKLVYLDLNHFINLARADHGQVTPDGYSELLTACRDAVATGSVRFVLSAIHYIEMAGVRDPRQRGDVAAVMEQLSGFITMLGRPNIVQAELAGAVAALVGAPQPTSRLDLLGYGVRYAFGIGGGFIINDSNGRDVTELVRADLGDEAFTAFAVQANTGMERAALAGPSDLEAMDLRATTPYRPEVVREGNERRAQQERELAAELSAQPRWRRGRLRDVISAREMALEWLPQLNKAVNGHFDAANSALSERSTARAFADCMPSWRVAISMKTRYHRDPNHRWTGNDINDIDAMSIAVPYCHVVFTDAAARHALTSAPELRGLTTFLPRNPADLSRWLVNLPKV